MKVLYVRVLLEKNEHFSTPVWMYPWELPVFAAAHRNNGIKELDKRTFEKRVAPRADSEFDRLSRRYQGPEGTDTTYVGLVYGYGSAGVRKLQQAMQEAADETGVVATAEANAPPAAPPPEDAEFASPFGDIPELPPDANDQAGLREFVSGGGAEASAEPVAINA